MPRHTPLLPSSFHRKPSTKQEKRDRERARNGFWFGPHLDPAGSDPGEHGRRPRGAVGPAKTAGGGGNSWGSRCSGWSSEPDYIDGPATLRLPGKGPRRRRRETEQMETEAFHDVMYHSAIASRLASDLPRRPRPPGSEPNPSISICL
ncbi:hypothetical protein C4D60_Mb10t03050 [Musa balbisiana]|uniref:Uncharacterized protein n=1 Tax=Musa balbisiana TaxID=52838 RepID=A0A4V4H4J0_MUSBA|nr:hypothetical protein C4D60_Mb10t03050 [Musa balbisiana]